MSVNLSDTQFQTLLEKISPSRQGSFTTCTAQYDGTKNSEVLEAFLAAVTIFKQIENITDADALTSIPLLMKGEAAIWWQGVKKYVTTWEEFKDRLRYSFAPKKPGYVLYQEIVGVKQDANTSTENFVAYKRMLLSQLPAPDPSESHQLDMIYGSLRSKIQDKIPRNSFKTFDELLNTARVIEQLWNDQAKESRSVNTQGKPQATSGLQPKKKCSFCHFIGHRAEECRKLKKKQEELGVPVQPPEVLRPKTEQTRSTQAPSPSIPAIRCYGCGAPGVVRSSCTTCAGKKEREPPADLKFSSFNFRPDVRARPVIYVDIDGIKGVAYIDTCAKTSIASYQLYNQLKAKGQQFVSEHARVTLADGIPKYQRVLKTVVSVKLEDRIIPTSFIVLPESKDNRTLLGIGFLQDAKMVLNLAQFTWEFIGSPITYELYEEDFVAFIDTASSCVAMTPPQDHYSVPSTSKQMAVLPQRTDTYKLIPLDESTIKRPRTVFDGYSPRFADFMMMDAERNIRESEDTLTACERDLFPSTDGTNNDIDTFIESFDLCSLDINDQQSDNLNKVLAEYEDVFFDNGNPSLLGEHSIVTTNDIPISVPPYRLSQAKTEVLKTEVDKMLQNGIIVPCTSPWASPVVMVPKPNGEVRVCIDYRRLNAITVPDTYPLPRIDDLLHSAKSTPFMTSLDLKAGYWQIKIRKEDEEKTAFITPFGVYKFQRMPFGLRNAPATFQRLVDRFRVTLGNMKLLAYLDDLILFSTTFEDHLADLARVLQKMREYNLTANKEKCKFLRSSIKYLGHIITPDGLKTDPDKTKAILERPIPKNVKQLVSFLQMCSWYRRFIENFSGITQPLTKLTKKKAGWEWNTEQEDAYNTLKQRLTTAPVLKQADGTKPYILKTDASGFALGAVLVQGEKEEEHPVEYASRLLTAAERNYSTTEREALAVVWALDKFRAYIDGLPITVITDHQALKWLMNLKSPTGRLARWALQLQSFDVNVLYQPGRMNTVADALSRPPCCEETCDICLTTIDMPKRGTKEVREEQMKDEKIKKIIEALEETQTVEDATYWSNKGYLMNNGMLYRLHPDSEVDDAQLLVPEHEWRNVLSAYHDDPLAGHYGAEKTYRKIANRYYWSGMRKYVTSYVQNCLECQRYKPSNQKPAGLLQTTTLSQRFEVVSFDLFGPLPQTEDGKTWILIAQDIATRWVELFALATASAENCATILINEIFLRYGVPRRLISDNGTQFVSAVMQQVTFSLNIKHQYTPLYHPESNPVERRNRELKTQLAIMVQGLEHNRWVELLPAVRFAMNSTNCSTTGQTPAYLTFGRELRSPRDNEVDFRNILISENIIPEITPKLKTLADSLLKAREVQEMKEEARKEYVDRQRRHHPQYRPGDLVLVNIHPISRGNQGVTAKFAPRRDGPYIIVQQHGPASYKVAPPNTPEIPIGLYHTSALTPYKGETSNEVPEPVYPLRRRGRPAKKLVTQTTLPASKRGRGRPRKQ